MLDAGVSVSDTGREGITPLHNACWEANIDAVKMLLDQGADIGAKDNTGDTPLHNACSCRDVRVARELLKAGAAVNAENNFRATPLHNACWHTTVNGLYPRELVPLLLAAGANIDAVDCEGRSPLHIVSSSGETSIVLKLVNAGANLALADRNGHRAIDLATWPDIIALLNPAVKGAGPCQPH